MGNDGRGAGVVQDVGCFVALVGGVDGHADGADERQPEPAIHELSAVGQEEADAVAVADARGLKHASGALDGVVEVAVGQLLAGNIEEDLIRVALHDLGKECAEGLLPREAGGGVGHIRGCSVVRVGGSPVRFSTLEVFVIQPAISPGEIDPQVPSHSVVLARFSEEVLRSVGVNSHGGKPVARHVRPTL